MRLPRGGRTATLYAAQGPGGGSGGSGGGSSSGSVPAAPPPAFDPDAFDFDGDGDGDTGGFGYSGSGGFSGSWEVAVRPSDAGGSADARAPGDGVLSPSEQLEQLAASRDLRRRRRRRGDLFPPGPLDELSAPLTADDARRRERARLAERYGPRFGANDVRAYLERREANAARARRARGGGATKRGGFPLDDSLPREGTLAKLGEQFRAEIGA